MKKVTLLFAVAALVATVVSCKNTKHEDEVLTPDMPNTVTVDGVTKRIARTAVYSDDDNNIRLYISPVNISGREIYETPEWICISMDEASLGQQIDLSTTFLTTFSENSYVTVVGLFNSQEHFPVEQDADTEPGGSLRVTRDGGKFEVDLENAVLPLGAVVSCHFAGTPNTQYDGDEKLNIPGTSTVVFDGTSYASSASLWFGYYGLYFPEEGFYNTDLDIYAYDADDNSIKVYFETCHAAPYLTPGVYAFSSTPIDRSFTSGSDINGYIITGGSFTLAVTGGVVAITFNDLTVYGGETLTGTFTYDPSVAPTRSIAPTPAPRQSSKKKYGLPSNRESGLKQPAFFLCIRRRRQVPSGQTMLSNRRG
jgi:hypothetical protein